MLIGMLQNIICTKIQDSRTTKANVGSIIEKDGIALLLLLIVV
jgi:hypothetical protein